MRARVCGARAVGLGGLVAISLLTPIMAVAQDPTQARAPAEDIRDIRGPKGVLANWLLPALLGAAAVIGSSGYAAWRWHRHRQRARILMHFEIALQRLEEIRALMSPARGREFGIAVSDIIRHYIEQRFEVIATQRTTEEFLLDLLSSTQGSLARQRPLLADFLQQCDVVKFGGMSLTLSSLESLYDSACVFVRETAKPDEPRDPIPAA
jgi:hypothetical protein